MAYECIACTEPTQSRFVFTDLEDGNVASVCSGHAPAFLISAFMEACRMLETDPAVFLAELMGPEPEPEPEPKPANKAEVNAARRRTPKKLEQPSEDIESELVTTE